MLKWLLSRRARPPVDPPSFPLLDLPDEVVRHLLRRHVDASAFRALRETSKSLHVHMPVSCTHTVPGWFVHLSVDLVSEWSADPVSGMIRLANVTRRYDRWWDDYARYIYAPDSRSIREIFVHSKYPLGLHVCGDECADVAKLTVQKLWNGEGSIVTGLPNVRELCILEFDPALRVEDVAVNLTTLKLGLVDFPTCAQMPPFRYPELGHLENLEIRVPVDPIGLFVWTNQSFHFGPRVAAALPHTNIRIAGACSCCTMCIHGVSRGAEPCPLATVSVVLTPHTKSRIGCEKEDPGDPFQLTYETYERVNGCDAPFVPRSWNEYRKQHVERAFDGLQDAWWTHFRMPFRILETNPEHPDYAFPEVPEDRGSGRVACCYLPRVTDERGTNCRYVPACM